MRETIRDFTLAVAALAALFAAFQSWTTERELAAFREEVAAEFAAVREEMAAEAAVREDLAEVRGQLQTTDRRPACARQRAGAPRRRRLNGRPDGRT